MVPPSVVVAATRSASASNFVAAKENGSACYVVAAKRSASDSILRCREGEWFRLQWPWQLRSSVSDSNFVAAKENSSACSSCSDNEVRVRFHSLLPQRRMVLPAERHYLTAAVIPDFRGQTWESLQRLSGIGPPACSDS